MWPGRGLLTSWITFSRSASRSDGHFPALMAPAWQKTSSRSPIPRRASMTSMGSKLIGEPKSREGERDHQGCREIEGERRRDRAIQGVTGGRSQRVEQKLATVRSEHGRSPDRGLCRLEASPLPATGN